MNAHPSNTSVNGSGEVIRIRKYPNRRLYDTSRSCHLTHDGVLAVLAEGKSVQVTDSRSGSDITNSVLLQILIERDPAKIAAIPSALIHRAMRADVTSLKAVGEMALASGASWEPSQVDDNAVPTRIAVNGVGHLNGSSNGHGPGSSRVAVPSVVMGTVAARAPIPLTTDASGRPKAKAKRLG